MIHYLEWDSEFFGINMAEIDPRLSFSPACMYEFIKEHKLDFIQALCEINNLSFIHMLEANHFHMADQKVTLKTHLQDDHINECTIEAAQISDIHLLRDIVKDMFLESRFYGFDQIF
ncbi:hypothetical protein [Paenibacillus sp. DMB20]|uniref:hypothetical protein n=1 Tax=Paenibacillus sp. DMB20 TaxID=1642570 RepID=UPI00069A0AFE|nr:hypothetical protein [Paenibacillus sp. DMB20]